MRAIGLPGYETRYSWFSTVVNLVLTVPLTLLFGVLGVVPATAIGLTAGSVYFVVLCRRFAGTARASVAEALAARDRAGSGHGRPGRPVDPAGWAGTGHCRCSWRAFLCSPACATAAALLPREPKEGGNPMNPTTASPGRAGTDPGPAGRFRQQRQTSGHRALPAGTRPPGAPGGHELPSRGPPGTPGTPGRMLPASPRPARLRDVRQRRGVQGPDPPLVVRAPPPVVPRPE
ncbi:hypothetical protein ACRAWF_21990 [Streptomyces sp. L7]